MIDKKTLLVLGAGSSLDYGYPSGPELVTKIVDGFSAYAQSLANNIGIPPELFASRDGFIEQAQKFTDLLREVRPDSIDAFLSRHNPDFDRIGAIAIAWQILTSEQISGDSNFSRRHHNRDNWQRYYFGQMAEGLYKTHVTEVLPFNTSVITFNYDRSFEASYLHYFSKNFKENDQNHIQDGMTVHHVYGCIAPEKEKFTGYVRTQGLNNLIEASKLIEVMYRSRGLLSERIPNYKEWIQQFERVFFLGFAYDDTNMQMLGFPGVLRSGMTVYGTAHKLPAGKLERFKNSFYGTQVGPILEPLKCTELLQKYL
jgi:hypothetical protein